MASRSSTPVSRYLPLLALFLAAAGISLASHRHHMGKEIVPWRSDLTSARKEALAGHKLLLLEFSAGWCPDCQQLKGTVWADPDVAAALAQKYVPVSIDVDTHSDLAGKFQIVAIPALFVIDPANDKILNEQRNGERDSADFLRWLTQPPVSSGPL